MKNILNLEMFKIYLILLVQPDWLCIKTVDKENEICRIPKFFYEFKEFISKN